LNAAYLGFGGHVSADDAFQKVFQCAHIDDIISHLQELSGQESQHRKPDSALSEIGSQALVLFEKNG
jgi:hypothetical protein